MNILIVVMVVGMMIGGGLSTVVITQQIHPPEKHGHTSIYCFDYETLLNGHYQFYRQCYEHVKVKENVQ